ncbi:hypothetical protein GCM10009850_104810 [Nonomuraea monospora]|uniref:Uncharacterized protein n=1 Tax=Nonomuraea monospora TaxID=568818 RepID=A0ABN3CZV1_9ACTN
MFDLRPYETRQEPPQSLDRLDMSRLRAGVPGLALQPVALEEVIPLTMIVGMPVRLPGVH